MPCQGIAYVGRVSGQVQRRSFESLEAWITPSSIAGADKHRWITPSSIAEEVRLEPIEPKIITEDENYC